jgi:hypothetical protein
MFSVITNIYNKKTKGPTLMKLFTVQKNWKRFFWQLEMFDVSTTGDTAHNDTISKFLPLGTGYWYSEEYWCTHVDSCEARLEYRIDVCRVTRGEHIEPL